MQARRPVTPVLFQRAADRCEAASTGCEILSAGPYVIQGQLSLQGFSMGFDHAGRKETGFAR